MKVRKLKRYFLSAAAAVACASVLAACGNGTGKKDEAQDALKTLEASESQKETDQAGTPAESKTDAAETEATTETTADAAQEATADVYGDGVDSVVAKAGENGLNALRDQLKGSLGTLCGFAYIGTVNEGEGIKDVINRSDTAKRFAFIKDLDEKKVISDGGNDLFVFIPTDEASKVVVNTFAESDNGKQIYSSDKGTPILIRTIDELNDSIEIIITDSAGNVGTFAPDITTGSVADTVYKDLVAYNFGTDATVSKNLDKQYLLDVLLYREPALNDLLAEGTSLSADSYNRIYIDDLEFYTLDFGHNENGKYIKDRYYAVSKDGTLVYRYSTQAQDWFDLLAFDWNSEQYK